MESPHRHLIGIFQPAHPKPSSHLKEPAPLKLTSQQMTTGQHNRLVWKTMCLDYRSHHLGSPGCYLQWFPSSVGPQSSFCCVGHAQQERTICYTPCVNKGTSCKAISQASKGLWRVGRTEEGVRAGKKSRESTCDQCPASSSRAGWCQWSSGGVSPASPSSLGVVCRVLKEGAGAPRDAPLTRRRAARGT